jgi:hypothetical protein
MAKVPKATKTKLAKLLTDYDLTGTPKVQDDPPQEAVMDTIKSRFTTRFTNILPGNGVKHVQPDPDYTCGGMFEPAPKDVDNYVDPGAEGIWGLNTPFKAPQGRA